MDELKIRSIWVQIYKVLALDNPAYMTGEDGIFSYNYVTLYKRIPPH